MKIIIAFTLSIFGFVANAQVFTSDKAALHIGDSITICGKIFSGRFMDRAANKPTLLNMGGVYPDNHLTIVIFEKDLPNFPANPERYYLNSQVCATGKLIEYRGKPEIIIEKTMQLQPDTLRLVQSNIPLQKTEAKGTAQSADTIVKVLTRKDSSVSKPLGVKKEIAVAKPASIKKDSVAGKILPIVSTKTIPANASLKEPAITGNEYNIKLTQEVNVRAAPRKESEVVLMLSPGNFVTVMSSKDGWSHVRVQKYSSEQKVVISVTGYIKNNVLR